MTDFGIARSLDVEHGVTQTGTVLGTGEYLAPEQASGEPVSPATDVYSLGVVLWELLAGDVPFAGENFVAVALRHVNEPPPSLRERRPDVPPRLAAAVDRALAKDPARRFPSMEAFADGAARLPRRGRWAAPPPPQDDDGADARHRRPRAGAAPRGPPRAARRRGRSLLCAARARRGGRGVRGRRAPRAAPATTAGWLGGGSSGAAVHLRGVGDYDPQGDGSRARGYGAARDRRQSGDVLDTERYDTQAFGG